MRDVFDSILGSGYLHEVDHSRVFIASTIKDLALAHANAKRHGASNDIFYADDSQNRQLLISPASTISFFDLSYGARVPPNIPDDLEIVLMGIIWAIICGVPEPRHVETWRNLSVSIMQWNVRGIPPSWMHSDGCYNNL